MKYYIAPIYRTESDVDFFPILKGLGLLGEWLDIRVVYNGTRCGLNDDIWAPRFWLPTADTAIRQLCYGFWSVDIDLSKMFLNSPLPKWLHKYLGVRMEAISKYIINMEGHHSLDTVPDDGIWAYPFSSNSFPLSR